RGSAWGGYPRTDEGKPWRETMKFTLRTKIERDLVQSGLKQAPVDSSNNAHYIWSIFYWQVVSENATKALKSAWERAVADGVVENDDQLRALGAGEHMLIDTNHFSVLASITKPRMLFDRDLFVEKVARKYKLEKSKLRAMAEECKVET